MTKPNNAALTANFRPYDSPLIEGVILGRKFIIYDEGGHDVEQAEFIAKAINCHDELLNSAKLDQMILVSVHNNKTQRECEQFAVSLGWDKVMRLSYFANKYRGEVIKKAEGK